MNPERAKTVSDIEVVVAKWKADVRRLREARGQADKEMLENADMMRTIIIGMLQDPVADFIITKYTSGETTQVELERELTEHLMEIDHMKSAKKNISQVAPAEGEEENKEAQ